MILCYVAEDSGGTGQVDPSTQPHDKYDWDLKSMGLYWTGTGFEERLNLMPPPLADSATSEPQQWTKSECRSEAAPTWVPAGKESPVTQYRVQQKSAPMTGKRFLVQADASPAVNGKQNDEAEVEAGPVSYDPVLGSWVRAQDIAASDKDPEVHLDSNAIASSAGIAFEEHKQKGILESGSLYKWTSWFRTGLEQRRVWLTPPPEKAPETQLSSGANCEEASAVPSSTATEETAVSQAPLAAEDGVAPASASSMTDTQDEAISDVQTAVDDKAPVAVSLPSTTQDMIVPDAETLALDEVTGTPTSPLGNEKPEATAWQSANDGEKAATLPKPSAGEAPKTAVDGNTSRWFVLNSVLGGSAVRQVPASEPFGRVPVLEVFSLAGGVGKTSLVATLGRALSAHGERALLVEATPSVSLQYFFGVCDCRSGVVRTFRPPASSSDAPILLASVDPEAHEVDSAVQGSLATDILTWAQGVSRVIVDAGTGSTATVRALSKLSPVVLVPLVPDVNSVVIANSIDSFFRRELDTSGVQPEVFFILNQFDSSLPLHLDIRAVLQERLGKRLLPLVLERTPVVSEALAEGMTIMDYAPASTAAARFTSLADWLERVLPPAAMSSYGRWIER